MSQSNSPENGVCQSLRSSSQTERIAGSGNEIAMFGKSVRGISGCFSRISSSQNLLRNATNLGKLGSSKVRNVSALSSALQLRLAKGNSSKNLISMQEKYGNNISKSFVSIACSCESPQILVQLIQESGIGTELQEDDDEMSSVSGKKKHRRKQKY